MEWSFETTGPVTADISVPAGVIEIEGGADGTVFVSVDPADGASRHAGDLVSATEVSCNGGKLMVRVPDRWFRNVDVRCRLVVPHGSSVESKTASADVRSTARLHRFDGSTASGDISLTDVEADAVLKSASGNFACDQVGGSLNVKGASSDVAVRHVAGDADVALASGDVSIGDAEASVKARTASGDIRIGRAHRGKVRADSASGDITIGVAPGVGALLDVTTVTGETSCDLPPQDDGTRDAPLSLVCRTASGDVHIERAAP